MTPGPVAGDIDAPYGDDWSGICDGKGSFLLSSVLESALGAWVTWQDEVHYRLVPPPSLGDPRLDALALHVRMSVRAEKVVIDGRSYLRVALPDETVVTTLVSDEGLETLRSALGPLLG